MKLSDNYLYKPLEIPASTSDLTRCIVSWNYDIVITCKSISVIMYTTHNVQI